MAKIDKIQHFRTITPGRVPLPGELEDGEFAINTADGIVFFKDSAGIVRQFQGVQEKVFNITSAGQTIFPVLASATKILTFLLNQLDYSEFASINPAGSGNIIYDDVSGEYVTEIGDYVKVLYF